MANPDIGDEYKTPRAFVSHSICEDCVGTEEDYNGFSGTWLYVLKLHGRLIGVVVHPDFTLGEIFYVKAVEKTITIYQEI